MSKNNTPAKIKEVLDNLNRWTAYKKDLCNTCEGLCCYMPVELETSDLIRMNILTDFHLELSLKEQTRDALKHPSVARYTPSSMKYTLKQKPNGTCYYLDDNKRCTIYEMRPNTCRNHPKVGPRPNFCAYLKKDN